MKSPLSTLRTMLLTEKAGHLSAHFNQYSFEVSPTANKYTIADAVEKTFNVQVTRVNIVNVKPRHKRSIRGVPALKPSFKKAIVTLKAGDKIEMA